MVDGKLHGMVMGYYEDGTKSRETPYVDGKRQGVMIKYHEDGSKSGEHSYVKGLQDGAQTLYHRNGSKYRAVCLLHSGFQISSIRSYGTKSGHHLVLP